VGVQVTGLLFQARLGAAGFVPAFRWAFLAAAAAAGLGLVLAAAGPRPARHRRPAAL
jgi:hypothetical protein